MSRSSFLAVAGAVIHGVIGCVVIVVETEERITDLYVILGAFTLPALILVLVSVRRIRVAFIVVFLLSIIRIISRLTNGWADYDLDLLVTTAADVVVAGMAIVGLRNLRSATRLDRPATRTDERD